MLHVGAPAILGQSRFLSRVERILDDRVLTNNGPFVRELEQQFCRIHQVPHCVAVSNASLGIELSIRALFEKHAADGRDQIIVPSFTFVATVNAIVNAGFTPVFCDIENDSARISIENVERLIGPSTAAILAVNLYGDATDAKTLEKLASEHELALIFDSSPGVGVLRNGSPLGGAGDAEVFSLHATKIVNGFEGGLVCTRDADLAEQLRLLRNHGFSGYDRVERVGTNAKLSEVHAAMALTNLEDLSKYLEINLRNFETYRRELSGVVDLYQFADGVCSNYHYLPVLIDPQSRDRIQQGLKEHKVLARRYFYPGVHRQAPYSAIPSLLPNTESLAKRVLCLPTGPAVSKSEVEYICRLIGELMLNEGGKARCHSDI